MLPEGFPHKALLEKEGYETIADVSEATDEELLAIDGIAEGKLSQIRDVAPFTTSPSETGSGETSGKTVKTGPANSLEPTAQSFQTQTSVKSKDQTDPVTGQDLPKGIIKNERGTLSASSLVDQDDMVSPDQIKAERAAMLRNAGEKIASLLG